MLPFLKPKNIATTIVAKYNSDNNKMESEEKGIDHKQMASSMLDAVKANDADALASILKEYYAINEEKE